MSIVKILDIIDCAITAPYCIHVQFLYPLHDDDLVHDLRGTSLLTRNSTRSQCFFIYHFFHSNTLHYSDVIMGAMASKITSLTRSKKISKLRVPGIFAGNSPVTGEFPHKCPVTRKMFPLMTSSWYSIISFLFIHLFLYFYNTNHTWPVFCILAFAKLMASRFFLGDWITKEN